MEFTNQEISGHKRLDTTLLRDHNDLMTRTLNAVKYDAGKPPMSMLPGAALEAVALVLDFGAHKYGRDNWRNGFSYSRLMDAAVRHLYTFQEGEDNDPETGLSHIAHASCCLLFLLHYIETSVGVPEGDDRPNTEHNKKHVDMEDLPYV